MTRRPETLSGPRLERFLRRLFGGRKGVAPETAQDLAQVGRRTFAAVRLKGNVVAPEAAASDADRETVPSKSLPNPASPPAMTVPAAAEVAAVAPADAVVAPAPFDPYCIGLLPTYQREGADGLKQRLMEITSLANLRHMARLQQVALPAALRGDDADPDAVRDAMVTATAKRLASRRAAAG